MLEWVANLDRLRDPDHRFIEVFHVDGRLFSGELVGIRETPNGPQLVLKDRQGRDVQLYYPAIRSIQS
jgi:hypothetical protein